MSPWIEAASQGLRRVRAIVFARFSDPAAPDDERTGQVIVALGCLASACSNTLNAAMHLAFIGPALALVVFVQTPVLLYMVRAARRMGTRRAVRVLVPMVLCVTPLQQYLAGGFAGPNGGAFWAVWGFTAPLAAALWLDGLTTGIVLAVLGLGIGTTLIAETLWPLSVPALPAGILRLLVLFNVASFGPVVVLGIRYAAQNRLQLARDLEREVRRSDALLLNVLPAAIAERLKTRPGRIAERFDPVTVLFADVVGFTPLASRMEPEQLVELLDDVFTRFDALAERLGLEKIKTIGDAYLVVGGLPAPRTDHAQAVADMALGMLRALADVRERSGLALDLRIGMHTGPVVAGVIGTHKFAYDLWGDAVNIAARMESHGAAGSIQVSADTAVLLQREFILEERGGVELKGRGAVRAWWLRGRRPEGGASVG